MTSITELPTKVIGMSNQAYRAEKEFDSRSFLHTVAKFGGEAQLFMDKGGTFFGGNSATSKGSDFDEIVTAILGGKRFEDVVVTPPDEVLGSNGSRSTKAYKEWATSQTGVICTAEQRALYDRMLSSIYACDPAYDLFSTTIATQVSVFFELGGHKLKTRPDACCESLWWDLKTTGQPLDRLFRSVLDYGYAEQEWLYVESAMALGMERFRMPFVFVQTVPPYACRVYRLPTELIENAGQRMLNVMEEVRLRRSTGHYKPADANEIVDLAIPAWAVKQEEEIVL